MHAKLLLWHASADKLIRALGRLTSKKGKVLKLKRGHRNGVKIKLLDFCESKYIIYIFLIHGVA